jgi:DNA-binding GntR family transcriptional regulator
VSGQQPISLSEAAYHRLRADILSCRLTPGQRLTEKQLAAETGFGISPVRDALTRLDQEGLVRTVPRKGYQVTPLTLKSIEDLFSTWLMIGPEVIRWGVLRADDKDLARVRAGFKALEDGQAQPGPAAALRFIDLAGETFLLLARAADNDPLTSILDRISGDIARVWMLILDADPSAMRPVPSQYRITDILDARDADMAAEIARIYIVESHERALEAIVRWPSVMYAEIVAQQP